MKTFYSLNEFLNSCPRRRKFVVTIGVFDGVHCAHQRIIETLIKKAKRKNSKTLLITFDPHPANISSLSKKVPLLISLKHRLHLLGEMGLDNVLVLRFDRKFAKVSAAKFIEKVLGKIHIDEIIVGKNFFFGNKKRGKVGDLGKFSEDYGYRLSVISEVKRSQKVISSTWIRSLILKGDLRKARTLLGRPVTVLGTVIPGHKRGRIIGFPTANINPHHEVIPPSGVYAVKISLTSSGTGGPKGKIYNGIMNIGTRPTFKGVSPDVEPTIEAHIFNFNKYIYGKDLEIIFVKKIRKEKRFKDAASLARRIKMDEKRARQILCP
ncbi:MAG: bifunctional riboflavin kinase/FAD synthetase [Candidatus Omnitrophica bacterium]|nr:bifunctional riboflavin kinase/FAD synthetase [Candidatus Omnitrophota bacterium]